MSQARAEAARRPAVIHRRTCRMCDSADLQLLLELVPTPPGDHYVTADALDVAQTAYPMRLVMCGGCGLAQLCDVVDPESLLFELGDADDHGFRLTSGRPSTCQRPRAVSL